MFRQVNDSAQIMLVKKRRGLARGGDQERTRLDKSRFIGIKHSICTVTPRKKRRRVQRAPFSSLPYTSKSYSDVIEKQRLQQRQPRIVHESSSGPLICVFSWQYVHCLRVCTKSVWQGRPKPQCFGI